MTRLWPTHLRPIALAMALLTPGGCIHVHVGGGHDGVPAELKGGQGLQPGDRVVARWKTGLFDATVLTVQQRLVLLAWDQQPPDRSWVPVGWVQLRAEEGGRASVGDWMLCRRGEVWAPCQVQDRDGRVRRVTWADDAREDTLAGEDTVDVPVELRGWLSRRAEAQLHGVRTQRELAGLRPVDAGQPVSAGQAVLATWNDGNWYMAELQGVEGEQAVVAWADGTAPSSVPLTRVSPLPAQPEVLAPGSLAICVWQGGARWWRARIGAVRDRKMLVEYIDGTEATLGAGECVPATL